MGRPFESGSADTRESARRNLTYGTENFARVKVFVAASGPTLEEKVALSFLLLK